MAFAYIALVLLARASARNPEKVQGASARARRDGRRFDQRAVTLGSEVTLVARTSGREVEAALDAPAGTVGCSQTVANARTRADFSRMPMEREIRRDGLFFAVGRQSRISVDKPRIGLRSSRSGAQIPPERQIYQPFRTLPAEKTRCCSQPIARAPGVTLANCSSFDTRRRRPSGKRGENIYPAERRRCC